MEQGPLWVVEQGSVCTKRGTSVEEGVGVWGPCTWEEQYVCWGRGG